MRKFDYSYLADRTWDNEIMSYISKIHEYKGKQELSCRSAGAFEARKRYDVGIHVYTKDTVYVWDFDKFGERDFLNGRMEVVERQDTDLSFLENEDIVKCLFVNTDFDYLN